MNNIHEGLNEGGKARVKELEALSTEELVKLNQELDDDGFEVYEWSGPTGSDSLGEDAPAGWYARNGMVDERFEGGAECCYATERDALIGSILMMEQMHFADAETAKQLEQ